MRGSLQVLREVPGWQNHLHDDIRSFARGEQTPPDRRTKILHATLALGDDRLTGADVPPKSYQKPQGFSVSLQIGDAGEADRIFKTLAEEGAVQMPVQEIFWALRFGMLVDQFGTPWIINCGKK
jgi:PhnB protein